MEKTNRNEAAGVEENRPSRGRGSRTPEEERIREWAEKNLPPMSPAAMQQVMRAVRCLVQPTQAGAERRAIMALLMKHEGVSERILYRSCTTKYDVRIRELKKAGVAIERWAEKLPNGGFYLVYGLPAFKLWRAKELMDATPEQVESLKRVV